MTVCPPHIVRWVSLHVIPQEQKVRAALRRSGIADTDADDLIQDAYCRLVALRSVDHIDRPGAFFMQVVKNTWRDRLRRARVIRFEDFTENTPSAIEGEMRGFEAEILAREQLGLVQALLRTLPERCRTIFTWKRMEGLSQREIAARLGVSENVVENDVRKALRVIQRALRSPEEEEVPKIDGRRQQIG